MSCSAVVVDGPEFTEFVRVGDGAGDVVEGEFNGLDDVAAFSEMGGNGAGKGAACAVGGDVLGARVRPAVGGAFFQDEDVGAGVALEVASLGKYGAVVAAGEGDGCLLQFVGGADGLLGSEQTLQFVEVGGEQGGARHEALLVDFDGGLQDERLAGSGNHDGVDYDGTCEVGQFGGDGLYDFRAVEHAGFNGLYGEMLQADAHLIGDEAGLHGDDAFYLARYFAHDAGQGGERVAAQRKAGLEVGLYAGTGRAVGTGYAEVDGCGHA